MSHENARESKVWLQKAEALFHAMQYAPALYEYPFWTMLFGIEVTLVGVDPWSIPEEANDNRKGVVE